MLPIVLNTIHIFPAGLLFEPCTSQMLQTWLLGGGGSCVQHQASMPACTAHSRAVVSTGLPTLSAALPHRSKGLFHFL